MAVDLLELIQSKVSSLVLGGDTTHLAEKESALTQFYPILLSLLSAKPDLIQSLISQINPRLGDLFAGSSGVKQEFLHQIAGAAPSEEIENTLSASIAPILSLLQGQAGSSEPSQLLSYLKPFSGLIQQALPHWATPLLAALGVGGASYSQAKVVAETLHIKDSVPYTPPVEDQPIYKEKTNKWWPIAALIAALVLLALLFKACSHKEPTADVAALATSEVVSADPATLQLLTGAKGEVTSCNILLGDAGFVDSLKSQIKQIFNSNTDCTVDTAANYQGQLTDQDSLPAVLQALKGIPNLGLLWVGDQVSIQAANAADGEKAVGLIQKLAKNVTVTVQAPLDVNSSVDSSISDAEKALASIPVDQVRASDVANALNMQIINFATASSAIPDVNKAVLDQAAALIQRAKQVQLTVEGHTDSTGDAAANKKLSQERAQSVVSYLVAKGADPAQLQAIGYGQEQPKADNNSEEGKFRNRRIEFKVLNTETGTVRTVDESGVTEKAN